MKLSRSKPMGWAGTARKYIGPVACCFLLYLVLSYAFRWWEREDDAAWRRLQSARTASSGHSPFELSTASRTTPIAPHLDNLEPHDAGWDSEVASDAISKQLKRVRRILESEPLGSEHDFSKIAAGEFDGTVMPPNACQTVFNNGVFQAQRLPSQYADFLNTDSLQAQLYSLLGTEEATKLRCSFKVNHIQVRHREATSRVLFQSVLNTDSTVVQSNAVCQCLWQLDTGEPRLRSLQILDFERVILAAGGRELYDDVTASVLGNGSEDDRLVFEEQLLRDVGPFL